MKILIIEDEALTAMNMEAVLEDLGHQIVAIADDEPSAMLATKNFAPDLAFVDVQLAGGHSGKKVAQEIAELGVQVIFTTGNCPGVIDLDYAIGCLHKPISDEQLVGGAAIADAIIRSEPLPKLPLGMHLFSKVGSE